MTNFLNWIKKNWIIVALCAVMLITLPALLVLSSLMNAKVRDSLTTRVSKKMGDLSSVEKTSISITPLIPGEPEFSANTVVNEKVLEQYKSLREGIKADADQVLLKALSINIKAVPEGDSPNKDVLLRALGSRPSSVLLKGLLPEPPAARKMDLPFKVNAEYIKAHTNLISVMNAGDPVPSEDIARQLSDFEQSFRRTQLNKEANESLLPEDQAKLSDAMLQKRMALYSQRASEISTYANPSVFVDVVPYTQQTAPLPTQYFEWQHQYWTHADIAAAIALANQDDSGKPAGIAGRETSVVKRVISISSAPFYNLKYRKKTAEAEGGAEEGEMFGEGASVEGNAMMEGEMGGGGGGGGKGGPIRQNKPTKGPEVEVPKNDNADELFKPNPNSISGRAKSALYDVRTVDLSVIVDSRRLNVLLDAISRTNFMTVTSVSLTEADVRGDLMQGFFYNNEDVLQADIEIETVWLREWTVPLMPPDVQEALEITQPEAAPAESSESEPSDNPEGGGRRGSKGRSDG